MESSVNAWREFVCIPTYEAGAPEKSPMFLEKRVYQGSSGVVYPYPVIEKIADEATDHIYNAIYLENEYIKVMILPELGGRVQMAYDKIAKRHFVYYNHVVKPALVGLAGPWISGGIEFNWPQHHRPSTFMPLDSNIERNPDGSITVWVGETERMFGQKGRAGFTLRPGTARLEIKGVLYNPTDIPQTFLWWANPAVAVNDHYQSVFPPDINAVFDHGKRAVSSFPIATGTYYKMDYSSGVDISNYKNIKVPTSYMGVNSKYDFEGGYENDTHAGMLHVASHHISPGKKQWTWGNGDFGRAWDRNLTDSDGPYIELMAGVYTENQPDFTWLKPYEEKRFTQYFFPYRELGVVKNASKDFVMNLVKENDQIILKLFATAYHKCVVEVYEIKTGNVVFEKEVELSPENIFESVANASEFEVNDLGVRIFGENGRLVLSWEAEPDEAHQLPDPAIAAPAPENIKSCDRLYLTGLHLEQYRHATFRPTDYYEEALRRDSYDVRCNNAMGLWYLRNGRFDMAEKYLEKAVKESRRYNPNPYDSEPIYNLALSVLRQGRKQEAYDLFAKAAWSAAQQDAAWFCCARIAVALGDLATGYDDLQNSLIRNAHNHKALTLKAVILHKMGRMYEAVEAALYAVDIDPFNFASLWILSMAKSEKPTRLVELMRDEAHNYNVVGLELMEDGAYTEADALWNLGISRGADNPMTYYHLARCREEGGLPGVDNALDKAAAMNPDYCFPKNNDAVQSLTFAIGRRPNDANAKYYLGCLYYDARQYEKAIKLWEESLALNPQYPLVWRNLALAYFNKSHKVNEAVELMQKALALNPENPRMLMELDQLYKRLGRDHSERLENLRRIEGLISERDDLCLEEATLLNNLGRYAEAKEIIDNRKFHPWEGGEGKVIAQYHFARVELAKEAIAEKKYKDAEALLNECLVYPENLGEGKLEGAQDNDFHYFLGVIAREMGDEKRAKEHFRKALEGPTEPTDVLYYNDAKPDKIFYQGLAHRALGDEAKACAAFYSLKNFGEKRIFEPVKLDYFAVSLPDLLIWEDDLQHRNTVHCHYLMALGYYGLGETKRAMKEIDRVISLDPNHQGVKAFQSYIDKC